MQSKIIILLPFVSSLLKISAHHATRMARVLHASALTKISKNIQPLSIAHLTHSKIFLKKILNIVQEAVSFTKKEQEELINLISKGANINALYTDSNNKTNTPAGFALDYNHLELLGFLLNQGAYSLTPNGTTSFVAIALSKQLMPLATILYKHGAKLLPYERKNFAIWQAHYPNFFIPDPREGVIRF